jgi:hypothetical protein
MIISGKVEIMWEAVGTAYINVPTWHMSERTKKNNKKGTLALTCLMTEWVDPAAADKPVGWEWSQGCL